MITQKKAILITILYSLLIAILGGMVGGMVGYLIAVPPKNNNNNAYVSAQEEVIDLRGSFWSINPSVVDFSLFDATFIESYNFCGIYKTYRTFGNIYSTFNQFLARNGYLSFRSSNDTGHLMIYPNYTNFWYMNNAVIDNSVNDIVYFFIEQSNDISINNSNLSVFLNTYGHYIRSLSDLSYTRWQISLSDLISSYYSAVEIYINYNLPIDFLGVSVNNFSYVFPDTYSMRELHNENYFYSPMNFNHFNFGNIGSDTRYMTFTLSNDIDGYSFAFHSQSENKVWQNWFYSPDIVNSNYELVFVHDYRFDTIAFRFGDLSDYDYYFGGLSLFLLTVGTVYSPPLAPSVLSFSYPFLTWTNVLNADKYLVYRNDVFVSETSSTSFMIDGLGNYKIIAVDNDGYYSSSTSNTVSVSGVLLDIPVLTLNDVFLTWSSVLNADKYEIYLNNVLYDTVLKNFSLEYSYKISIAGSYKIKAISNNWYYISSDFSNSVSVVSQPLQIPSISVVSGHIIVWDSVPYASSYDIYISDGSGNYHFLTNVISTSYIVVNDGSYRIKAVTSNPYYTNSNFSNSVAISYSFSDNNSFMGLIGAVVDVPLSIFISLFNFDFLGINLFTFFSSMISLCIVIIIIKFVLSK